MNGTWWKKQSNRLILIKWLITQSILVSFTGITPLIKRIKYDTPFIPSKPLDSHIFSLTRNINQILSPHYPKAIKKKTRAHIFLIPTFTPHTHTHTHTYNSRFTTISPSSALLTTALSFAIPIVINDLRNLWFQDIGGIAAGQRRYVALCP